MNLLAHPYVNASNRNCYRKDLMYDQHLSRKSFFQTILFAPIFFFGSAIMCLRSTSSLSSTACYDTD
jgi:hypothetical protein